MTQHVFLPYSEAEFARGGTVESSQFVKKTRSHAVVFRSYKAQTLQARIRIIVGVSTESDSPATQGKFPR